MKLSSKAFSLAVFAAFLLCLAPQAYAKSDHAKQEHGKSEHGNHESKGSGPGLNIEITTPDRATINNYLRENYHPPHCPPGLAKKNKGCLPPGQAKKYRIGHRLPSTVVFKPLPENILVQLSPVPGYRYVQVDQDILLIGEATKKVIDAVTLLSAVK